ncbi:FHA domain-containing protein [Anaerosporobacter faecicola]|uniref:FHA domain-containing protein n=1 Tax=Anaerosporobacter faecicola TaxID=2718714 RepID=UPI00143A31D0|nr:FHA domain-containing protein [Anaerosporobacter faecicola]
MKKKVKMVYIVCLLICALLPAVVVRVATMDQIFHANSNNGYLYVLSNIKDLKSEQVKCQLDGSDCAIGEIAAITKSDVKLRTIVLIDVSKSVTSSDKKTIKSIIKGLISNLADNEQMEIDAIGKDLEVLQAMTEDKFELYSSYEKIKYAKQATYITTIMPEVIAGIKQSMEAENCFYRLIIFSDDYVDENGSLAANYLLESLQEAEFPIYTVGCLHDDNEEKLKNLYDFSVITGGESFTLKEKTKPSKIIAKMNQFYEYSLIKAKVPDELRDGTNREVSLLIQQEGKAAKKISSKVLLDKLKITTNTKSTEYSEPNIAESDKKNGSSWLQKNKIFVIGGVVFVVIILGGLITIGFIRHRRKHQGEMKKRKGIRPEVTVQTGKDLMPNYETKVAMDFMDLEEDYNETIAIKPQYIGNRKSTFAESKNREVLIFKLNDVNNNRVFGKTVNSELYIGRTLAKDTNKMIVIDYDPSVSKLHCRIYESGGKLYVTDLGSLNGTYLNGVSVDEDAVLADQDILDIGQVKLKVSITINSASIC